LAVNHKPDIEHALRSQSEQFPQWEKLKDCIDQFIDIMLNYRQSGHPGGSRSKVHAMVSLLLSATRLLKMRSFGPTVPSRWTRPGPNAHCRDAGAANPAKEWAEAGALAVEV